MLNVVTYGIPENSKTELTSISSSQGFGGVALARTLFAFKSSSVALLIVVECDITNLLHSKINEHELTGNTFILDIISIIPSTYVHD